MNNTNGATLIWSLGAVIFSLVGVYTALTSSGLWYQVATAVFLLLAGGAFAAKAVLTVRANAESGPNT